MENIKKFIKDVLGFQEDDKYTFILPNKTAMIQNKDITDEKIDSKKSVDDVKNIYTSIDDKTNNAILAMVFLKSDTTEVYKKWCNYDLK